MDKSITVNLSIDEARKVGEILAADARAKARQAARRLLECALDEESAAECITNTVEWLKDASNTAAIARLILYKRVSLLGQ